MDNDEVRPGISGRLTRAARCPPDPPAIAQLLGLGNRLVLKIRMHSPDLARDAIDFVSTAVRSAHRIIEHTIFGEELVDGRSPASGVTFTEDVLQIAGQQGRYAGHGHLLTGIECDGLVPVSIQSGRL